MRCCLGSRLAFCFEIGEGKVSRHVVQAWGLAKRMLVVVVVGVVSVVIFVVARGGELRDGK